MSRDSRRIALLALPVVCCAAHAVLLAVGVGSVTALVGGAAGSAAVAAAGLLVLVAAAAVVWRRRRRPESAAATPSRSARAWTRGRAKLAATVRASSQRSTG